MGRLHFTLAGRGNILKMNILPKVLYLFRSIPLEVTRVQLQNLQSLCVKFLWAPGKSRRAIRFMTLPMERGGWAIPDLALYYYVCFLLRMRVLLTGEEVGDIAEAPSIFQLILGSEARHCLFKEIDGSYFKRTRFKVLDAAFKVWRKIRKLRFLQGLTYCTPTNSLKILPSIFGGRAALRWRNKGILQIGDLYKLLGQLLQYEELARQYNLPKTQFLKFLQIRDFLGRKHLVLIPNTLIEAVRRQEKSGVIYKTLMSSRLDDLEKRNAQWSGIQGEQNISLEDAIVRARETLLSENLKIQFYKTAFNLYYTPDRMFKWGVGLMVNVFVVGGTKRILHIFFLAVVNYLGF